MAGSSEGDPLLDESPKSRNVASPVSGWGLATILVLSLYGLAMNCSRNVFYTQKSRMEADLHCSSAEITNTLGAGYLIYAFGKIFYGFSTSRISGKSVFSFSFLLAGLATMAFVFATSGSYMLGFWVASRAFQPAAFVGQAKQISVWFRHTELARILAFLSVSFYAFDALTRLGISGLVGLGLSWRQMFLVYGGITTSIGLISAIVLRAKPESVGLLPPSENPHSVVNKKSSEQSLDIDSPKMSNIGVWTAFLRLASNPRFCLVCFGAVMTGTLREVFETYLSNFLQDKAGANHGLAVAVSAVFPLFGVPGVIVSGWLVDKYHRRRNGLIMLAFTLPLAILCVTLWVLVRFEENDIDLATATVISALIGFCSIGPYTLLSGTFPMDLGGKVSTGLAVGLADFSGYVGPVVFFFLKDRISEHTYSTVMLVVAVCGVGLLLVSCGFMAYDQQSLTKPRADTESKNNNLSIQ